MDVSAKYLKDGSGDIFSPVTSAESVFSSAGSRLIDMIYPVGSIYISVNNINPGTYLLNTTWEQLKDRFLLGAGDTYSAGSTGGSSTKTIAKENIPNYNLYSEKHKHSFSANTGNATATSNMYVYEYAGTSVGSGHVSGWSTTFNNNHSTVSSGSTSFPGAYHRHSISGNTGETTITVSSGGSGTALDIMNPYLAVYMYKRTT